MRAPFLGGRYVFSRELLFLVGAKFFVGEGPFLGG